nr:hypothetical protein [Tanacetum cinerariifolium]
MLLSRSCKDENHHQHLKNTDNKKYKSTTYDKTRKHNTTQTSLEGELVVVERRRRRIPAAVAAGEPRGVIPSGLDRVLEVVWDWDEPLAIDGGDVELGKWKYLLERK